MKNARSLFLILLAGMTLSSCQLLNGPSQSSEVPSSSESNPVPSSSSAIEDLKTPVYEGMSIATPSDEGNTGPLNRPKRKGNDHDQGWHNGWGNRDHDDEIEDDIETLTDIEIYESSETEYFINPGELFIIEVHLSNPYDFEIQSFTLNGNKYSSYMFERGSTMELLRLEVRAPEEPGLKEYTIDAIKYIDGTEIKDVRMSGERTIKAGFTYLDAPSAQVTRNVTTTSVSFDITLSDPWSRIPEGTTQFFLTDGKTILAQQILQLGQNPISVTGLCMSTAYQYGIVTAFDLLDGQGFHSVWLAQETLYTDSAIAITIGDVSETSLSFSSSIDPTYPIEGVTYSLYDESTGALVATMDEPGTFSSLLSDHDYTIYADYAYQIGEQRFTDWRRSEGIHTGAKIAPAYSFATLTADKAGVTYSVVSEDPSHIGTLTAVKVYDGETLVAESRDETGTFANLLSNHNYAIVAEYSYDLNDGEPVRTGNTRGTFMTLVKSAPTVLFNATVLGTSLSYVLVFNDPDQIAVVESVSVYKQGEETPFLTQEGKSVGVFSDLLTDAEYYAIAKISYDLNDGSPALSAEATYSFYIDAKQTPSIGIQSLTAEKESISYSLDIANPSETLVEYRVELIDDGNVVQSFSNKDQETFSNVLSNHYYSIHVAYSYDLGDGKGVQAVDTNDTIDTPAKQAPTVTLANLVREGNDIQYSFTSEDPDNVLVLKKARLVGGSETIAESTSCASGTFENAPTDIALSVALDYSYDLNDGEGETEKTLTSVVPLNAFYYDEDGTTLLGRDIYASGTEPVFKGETPTKANNVEAGLQYSFSHWNPIETTASHIKFAAVYEACTIGLAISHEYVASYDGDATEIVVPSHWEGYEIQGIDNYAFRNCKDITSVELPATLTYINSGAFTNCKALSNISLPAGITRIGDNTFEGCESLTSIVLPEGIQEIAGSLFRNCTSLSSVNIPESVKTIGDWAFVNCGSLESLFVPASVTEIGYGPFSLWDGDMMTVFMEAEKPGRNWSEEWNYTNNPVVWGATNQNSYDDPISGLRYAISTIGGEVWATVLGINTNSEHFDIPATLGGAPVKTAFLYGTKELKDSLKSIYVPDGVKVLSDFNFQDFAVLSSVYFGEGSITSIGFRAFFGCDLLASLTIPNSVVSIGDDAFHGCSSLTSVVLPNSVTSIGYAIFGGCSSLTSAVIPSGLTLLESYFFSECSSLTSYVVPDSISEIGYGAFFLCNSLSSIVLPAGLKSIGEAAFDECRALNAVYYGGTSDGWNSIVIRKNNEWLTNATLYFFSEVEPSEEGNFWHYVEGVPTAW